MDVKEYNGDTGYHMGVYLCLGQTIHGLDVNDAKKITQYESYNDIHQIMSENGKIFLFLGEGIHKITVVITEDGDPWENTRTVKLEFTIKEIVVED